MPTVDEVTEFVLTATHRLVDEVIEFIGSGPLPDEGDYDMALIRVARRHEDDRRLTHEGHAALSLLMAAEGVVYPDERDLDDVDSDIGFERLRDGDRDGALAIADALVEQVGRTPNDEWNHANLIHDAHIIRGKVRLAEGDIDGAAVELLAAGDVDGSPQLNSFGPDLSLAWSLMTADRPDAALAYFQRVARFWSPSAPEG